MKNLLTIIALTGLTAATAQAKDIMSALEDCGQFKTLVAAVKAAGLSKTLESKGNYTVFAPNDHAFARLPKGTVENLLKPENKQQLKSILTFHVLGEARTSCSLRSGELETVNGAHLAVKKWGHYVLLNNNHTRVREADVKFDNGVVHVIDRVMLPPKPKTEFTSTSSKSKPADIVDTAVAAGNFKTLAAALKAAGLVDTLKGKGPFTVFAPTDKAFSELPKGTVESLLKPENKDKLIKILTYHVVAGKVESKDIKPGKVETVANEKVKLKLKDGQVFINKSNVIKADINAANGVIHVIDKVLLPKDRTQKTSTK